MTIDGRDQLLTRAIEWHVRLRDGDDATWDAFAAWIEEDPRHAAAYDRIESLDQAIEPLLPALAAMDRAEPIDDEAPSSRRRFGLWAGGALAASVVAGLFVAPQFGSRRYEVETAAGERRDVRLDAGTEVVLNGATRLVLDRRDPRYAALIYGQALFNVRHDATKPFVLDVGEARIVDLGTVFDVVRDRADLRVAVAEGRVRYAAPGRAVALDAGQALLASRDGTARISPVSADAVGAWRRRRLLYSSAPLSQVARDIARILGVPIRVAPEIAGRPVSGNLTLAGASPADIRRIGIALDVTLTAEGDGWLMGPPGSARR